MGDWREQGIQIETGDNKVLVWGWVAVVAAVAIGVAVIQLSAAIATGILIMSGCAGLSMLVFTAGRVYAGVTLARAHAKKIEAEGKAAVIGARGNRLLERED